MGLKAIEVNNNGKKYRYNELRYLIPEALAQELLAIPEADRKQEIIRRLEAGSLGEQIRAVLTEILGSSTIALPQSTKENAISALHLLGGLY